MLQKSWTGKHVSCIFLQKFKKQKAYRHLYPTRLQNKPKKKSLEIKRRWGVTISCSVMTVLSYWSKLEISQSDMRFVLNNTRYQGRLSGINTYKNNVPLNINQNTLKYKPKGRRDIGIPRKRWRGQLHFEDQGTGNTTNPSGT